MSARGHGDHGGHEGHGDHGHAPARHAHAPARHAHAHGRHGHAPAIDSDAPAETRARHERAIAIAAGLTGLFMVAEVAGGLVSGSLALIADAGHMATDFASLALAWLALRIGRRPADRRRTYGFDRFSVLAAFVNGLSLFAISAFIAFEAAERLLEPAPILGGTMLAVAVAGLAVNVAAFLVLTRAGGGNLNLRAASLHVMGDLLGSVAAIVAALVVMATGWTPIDPILSVAVVLLILRSAWAVVRESGHVLLEGAPPGFDVAAVTRDLEALPGVAGIHHFHAWSIIETRPMATLEVTLAPGADPHAVKGRVKERLGERFGIEHSTVEVQAAAEGATQPRAGEPA